MTPIQRTLWDDPDGAGLRTPQGLPLTCQLGHHNASHRWCPYCPTFFDVALAATRARYAHDVFDHPRPPLGST